MDGLQQISDSLFYIHLDQTDLSWESIEPHLRHLSSTLEIVQNQLKDASIFDADERQLSIQLQQFVSSDAIVALNAKIESLCKIVDKPQQKRNRLSPKKQLYF